MTAHSCIFIVPQPSTQVKPLALIPDYVEIELSQGQVALVSPEDADRVNQFKWSVSFVKGVPYASRGKKQPNGKQSIEYLHRFILQPELGQKVDHADHNTLDDRRYSEERQTGIRIATHSENMANRPRSARNRSGYIGVRLTSHGTYSAAVNHLDKYISLGAYPDAITAAKVRDKKAFEIWGEFAVLNFPLVEAQPLPVAA